MTELTVILKDSEQRYTKSFPCYETYTASAEDPFIISCIEDAKKNLKEINDDLEITVKIVISC